MWQIDLGSAGYAIFNLLWAVLSDSLVFLPAFWASRNWGIQDSKSPPLRHAKRDAGTRETREASPKDSRSHFPMIEGFWGVQIVRTFRTLQILNDHNWCITMRYMYLIYMYLYLHTWSYHGAGISQQYGRILWCGTDGFVSQLPLLSATFGGPSSLEERPFAIYYYCLSISSWVVSHFEYNTTPLRQILKTHAYACVSASTVCWNRFSTHQQEVGRLCFATGGSLWRRFGKEHEKTTNNLNSTFKVTIRLFPSSHGSRPCRIERDTIRLVDVHTWAV